MATAQASALPPALRDAEVAELDGAVEAAIRAGEPGDLRVLGYGEITLVLGWPSRAPRVAVKRLPAFPDAERARRYEALLEEYVGTLASRGVPSVPTGMRTVAAGKGGVRAYLLQPLVEHDRLLHEVLRERGPGADGAGERLLARLAELVAGAVDARVGMDAQASNWAVSGETLELLDVSTPMLRDAAGRTRLDLSVFVAVYPWVLRRALVPVGQKVMAGYHDARTVLLDIASNLVKERLDRWLPAFLDTANRHVSPAIGEPEVRRYFSRDRALWLTLQRLRRADRAWQRRARRRPYPFLLPPPYAYGPQELP